jgi:polyisoprenoid-binding protein YceI
LGRIKHGISAHPVTTVVVVLLVVGAGVAAWAATAALRPPPPTDVAFVVPEAPRLTPNGPSQTVYRVDPTRSSVSYEVDEILAGVTRTATGTTRGVAGDLLVDDARPADTKVGPIVVNVEQLTSDQSLRDDRLRHEYLQSTDHPLATLTPTAISGLPERIVDGTRYDIELKGDLQVKQVTRPVTLAATASRADGEVTVTGSTTVRLAEFGVGPISLGGFVKTGETAKLVIDLTAVDAARPVPNAVAAPSPGSSAPATGVDAQAVAAGAPSFAKAVQPVLERNCASCHGTGGPGAGIWTLDTAGDATRVAGGLGLVTQSGYMPPWPASDAGIPLRHDARLSADELSTITSWAAAGGPLDVDPATPVKANPDPADGRPLRRDLVLPMPEPYQGSPDNVNDYRCFVLDPEVTDRSFITGFQFEPDRTEVVHHALAFRVSASQRQSVEQLDRDDDGSGWQCYVGMSGPGGEVSPTGQTRTSTQIMGWAPGQGPTIMPEGSGIAMEPGDFLVVQIHYHFMHQAPVDQSRFVLEMARDTTLDEIDIKTYLAPAEIPCRTGESGPLCDRASAMERLTEQFGPTAATIGDGLMLLCGSKVEDYAGMTDGVASASCDHRIRDQGTIVSVVGHMHEIGATFRMTLNPGTPEEKILLDIPQWDFDWQLIYEPVETIQVGRGDTLRVECSWDRSKLKIPEPRYIIWAEGTEDEMCYSVLGVRKPAGS